MNPLGERRSLTGARGQASGEMVYVQVLQWAVSGEKKGEKATWLIKIRIPSLPGVLLGKHWPIWLFSGSSTARLLLLRRWNLPLRDGIVPPMRDKRSFPACRHAYSSNPDHWLGDDFTAPWLQLRLLVLGN